MNDATAASAAVIQCSWAGSINISSTQADTHSPPIGHNDLFSVRLIIAASTAAARQYSAHCNR